MKSFTGRKRRTFRSVVILIELLICYITFLNVISHMRGPDIFIVAESNGPLLQTRDFVAFDGESGSQNELVLENDSSATVVGYSAELDLTTVQRIRIDFYINCTSEYRGSKLYIDLFNSDGGYDYAEQEVCLELQEGNNHIEISLDKGANAPEKAQLRMFTGETVCISIHDINVWEEILAPQKYESMFVALAISLIILFGTIYFYHIVESKKIFRNGLENVDKL